MRCKTIIIALFVILLAAGCAGGSGVPAVNTTTPAPTQTPSPAATRVFASPVFLRSPTPTRAPTLAPATPVLSATPTMTATPTLTPTVTPTKVIYARGLDMPIGDYYKFVIHKAQRGDKLEDFAQKYNTTVAAMLAINYHLSDPPWENTLFVIPVNFSNVEGMPMFVVYTIKREERGISTAALAKKLRVDLFDLQYYNGMTLPAQRPLVGDLILVPWFPNQNRKVIFDGPDWWDLPPDERETIDAE